MALEHPLTAYRKREKLKIGELAGLLRVDRVTVWRWEQGRMPDRAMWPKIATVTGVRPEELVRFAGTAE